MGELFLTSVARLVSSPFTSARLRCWLSGENRPDAAEIPAISQADAGQPQGARRLLQRSGHLATSRASWAPNDPSLIQAANIS
jgi:hypothetical protein